MPQIDPKRGPPIPKYPQKTGGWGYIRRGPYRVLTGQQTAPGRAETIASNGSGHNTDYRLLKRESVVFRPFACHQLHPVEINPPVGVPAVHQMGAFAFAFRPLFMAAVLASKQVFHTSL